MEPFNGDNIQISLSQEDILLAIPEWAKSPSNDLSIVASSKFESIDKIQVTFENEDAEAKRLENIKKFKIPKRQPQSEPAVKVRKIRSEIVRASATPISQTKKPFKKRFRKAAERVARKPNSVANANNNSSQPRVVENKKLTKRNLIEKQSASRFNERTKSSHPKFDSRPSEQQSSSSSRRDSFNRSRRNSSPDKADGLMSILAAQSAQIQTLLKQIQDLQQQRQAVQVTVNCERPRAKPGPRERALARQQLENSGK